MKFTVIDLFSGSGGWIQAFPTDWNIYGYDIKDFKNKYPGKFSQCDLLTFSDFPETPDLITASPPCTEFSKASFPPTWKSVINNPPNIPLAIELFQKAKNIIQQLKPKYWIIENVRGSQKYMGQANFHIGSRYFWSNMILQYTGDGNDIYGKWRLRPSPDRAEIRSRIPRSISETVRNYILQQENDDPTHPPH